jgi:hypothetical protein
MNDDAALLRRYVDERSESALAGLVHGHLDLVCSVALRGAGGDPNRATDMTQEVFSKLAREAEWVFRHAIVPLNAVAAVARALMP